MQNLLNRAIVNVSFINYNSCLVRSITKLLKKLLSKELKTSILSTTKVHDTNIS